MGFYYVITVIDQDPDDLHRLRFHVYTKAMAGKQGHESGYTFTGTHTALKKIKNPPRFVVIDSKKLIAQEAGYLL